MSDITGDLSDGTSQGCDLPPDWDKNFLARSHQLYDDESYDSLKAIWANPKGEVFEYDSEDNTNAKKSFEEFCGLSSGIAEFE